MTEEEVPDRLTAGMRGADPHGEGRGRSFPVGDLANEEQGEVRRVRPVAVARVVGAAFPAGHGGRDLDLAGVDLNRPGSARG
ncbi:hypothetical protein ACFPM0_25460 [Pseudonocardia sulfidoxydans]|uniref:hypothetical protein n=1 Tax=Pseudonocardia sulfidoxydans TaxID=54011 RepID=UPI0036071322